MASNFALSLASDGLRLLHREDGGWTPVGEVAASAADLPSAMATLRRKAFSLEPEGLRTKLLIPNGQIRYIILDDPRAGEAEIRAALDGATSLAVDELVWDVARGGGRTYVAAVARETLEEAESFAIAHGFSPVSFAAVPAPFTFRGEAYFGPTSVAGHDIDFRDPRPVAIVDARQPVPSSAADATWPADSDAGGAAEPTPAARPEPDADVAAGEPAPPAEPASAWPEADAEPAATEAPDLAPLPPLAAEARPVEKAVSFASRARVAREAERTAPPPLERPIPAEASTGAAAFVRRRDEPALRSVAGPRPGPSGGDGARLSPRPGPSGRPAAAMPRPAPIKGPAATAVPQPAPRLAEPTPDAAAAAATLKPIAPAPAPAGRRLFGRTAAAEPEPDPAIDAERKRMTVFGARSSGAGTRGKPRFLGLILTLILLLAMAAVAAWAIGDEISAWLGGEGEPPIEIAVAPEPVPDPAEVPAEAGAASADVSDLLPAPPDMPADSADAAEAAPPEPDLEPAGVVVSPAEAERFYAATGVWIRGARLPLLPRSEGFELPVSVVTRPADLPEEPVTEKLLAVGPDVGLGTQPVPPPAGTVFPRDERGFILATPQGTLGPAGLLVVAGAPDDAPPTRPGTEPPAIPPEIGLERLVLAAAPDAEPVPPVGGDGGTAGLAVPGPATLPETEAADTTPVIVTEPTLPVPPDLPPEAIAVVDAAPPAEPPTRPGTAAVPSVPDVAAAPEAAVTPTGQVEPLAVPTIEGSPPVLPPLRPAAAETPAAEGAGSIPEAAAAPAAAPVARLADGAPPAVPPARAPATEAAVEVAEGEPATERANLAPAEEPAAPIAAVAEGPPPVVPPQRPLASASPNAPAAPDGDAVDPPVDAGTPAAVPSGQDAANPAVEQAVPPVVPPTRAQAAAPDPVAEVVLVSAKPPAVPPGRPATRIHAAAVAAVSGTPPVLPPRRPEAGPTTTTPGGVALAGLAPGAAPAPALPPLPPYDGLRPVPRQPAAAAPQDQPPLPSYQGIRPALRPAAVTPPPDEEPAPEEAAPEEPPPVDVNATLAAIVAGAPDPLAGATAAAVPRAVRPDSRPQNFATVVSRAREQVARSAPAPAPQTAGAVARQEEEADDEPEVASAAAARPSGPTPGGVAGAATQTDVMNLREVNLIGVYGRPSDRRALIRLGNGRYVRVSVGDRFEGGQVTAIGDNALNYVARGRTYLLQIPEG